MNLDSIVGFLARSVPDHASKSFSPPQDYKLDGEEVIIIGSDGRKVRFSAQQVHQADGRGEAPVPRSGMPRPDIASFQKGEARPSGNHIERKRRSSHA